MRKANFTILIIGAVGAGLLSVMAWHLEQKSPGLGERMQVAQLVRSLYGFRSVVVTEIGEAAPHDLHVACMFGPDTPPEHWGQETLQDIAKFVDLNFPGERKGLRDIRVRVMRETGSGCSLTCEHLDLAKPLPLTPEKTPK